MLIKIEIGERAQDVRVASAEMGQIAATPTPAAAAAAIDAGPGPRGVETGQQGQPGEPTVATTAPADAVSAGTAPSHAALRS